MLPHPEPEREMDALVLNAERKTATVQKVPVPLPGPSEVQVQVKFVALNPVDALYVASPLGSTGRVVGSDFAGVVTASHDDKIDAGQRVAGFLQGACSANERPGAFAEYLVSPGDLVWKIPDNVTWEEAATMSLCGLTAAQAIYHRLGLEAPFAWEGKKGTTDEKPDAESTEPVYFFIYGASTSVAMHAAQLIHRSAEVSGKTIKLLGTASKSKFDLLKAEPYNYDELVDYRDGDWPEQIRKVAGGKGVHYAYDCISEGSTVELVGRTIRHHGRIAIVRSRAGGAWKAHGLPVEPIYGAVWEGLGVEIQYQNLVVAASAEARVFAAAFYRWLSGGGKLVANPIRSMPGGLGKIVDDGFSLLGSGLVGNRDQSRTEPWMKPVSGEKLVYKIV